MKLHNVFLPVALVALISGCATISNDTYSGTASGYNIAMQQVGEEQLLLNIVRLRYRDAPYFFETSSLTAQFDLSLNAGMAGTFPLTGAGTDVLTGAAGVSFSERPTISYIPMQGEDFFKRLLERFSFGNLILLTNSGWSIETVSRLLIQKANDLPNAIGASGPTPFLAPTYQSFHEVSSLLFDLQKTDEIMMGEVVRDDINAHVIFMPTSGIHESADRLREALSLDNERDYYYVVPGVGTRRDSGDTIEINTRSLLGVLFYLSHAVNVPEAHADAGLVTVTRHENGELFDWNNAMQGLFRVDSSLSRPKNASTAIRYRGHWYYISDNDLQSKTTFVLLSQMFSLHAGDVKGQIPLLTIPVSN